MGSYALIRYMPTWTNYNLSIKTSQTATRKKVFGTHLRTPPWTSLRASRLPGRTWWVTALSWAPSSIPQVSTTSKCTPTWHSECLQSQWYLTYFQMHLSTGIWHSGSRLLRMRVIVHRSYRSQLLLSGKLFGSKTFITHLIKARSRFNQLQNSHRLIWKILDLKTKSSNRLSEALLT